MVDAKIEFGTFELEERVNPYLETIETLIAGGDNAAVTITVDHDKENKDRLLISKAANAKDKTARLRLRDDSKIKYGIVEGEQVATGGTVRLTYTLTARHKARRRKSVTEATEAAQA